MGLKHIVVITLTFQGHVTSRHVTWPFDSPYAISYQWSFGIVCISSSMHIGVMIFHLSGSHDVISHVTIQFAIISHWWSFRTRTERLCPDSSKHIWGHDIDLSENGTNYYVRRSLHSNGDRKFYMRNKSRVGGGVMLYYNAKMHQNRFVHEIW